jgi:trimethylamine:corrinoid methyltransferase-like protein
MWQASGSKQISQTANQKFKEILAKHHATNLPADAEKDLKRFVDAI